MCGCTQRVVLQLVSTTPRKSNNYANELSHLNNVLSRSQRELKTIGRNYSFFPNSYSPDWQNSALLCTLLQLRLLALSSV